jgi:hypothetical protein
MDNRNRSHLILQEFQSNIFQIVIWPSLQNQLHCGLGTKKKILTKDSDHDRENKVTNLSTQAFVVSCIRKNERNDSVE